MHGVRGLSVTVLKTSSFYSFLIHTEPYNINITIHMITFLNNSTLVIQNSVCGTSPVEEQLIQRMYHIYQFRTSHDDCLCWVWYMVLLILHLHAKLIDWAE